MLLFSKKDIFCEIKPALFLDRDGVINKDYGYVCKKENFDFIDNIFSLIIAAKAAGYLIVVVTNQSGIGRGFYTLGQFKILTEWMCSICSKNGADIDAIYFSPFHPTEAKGKYLVEEKTRKPKPGMIYEAVADLNIDLSKSILVGDKVSDVQAGIAASIPTNFLLLSGREIFLPKDIEDKVKYASCLPEIIPFL